MSAPLTPQLLDRIGRKLIHWNAQLRLVWTLTALIAVVWASALLDFFLRFGQGERYAAWGLLLALALSGLWLIRGALARRYSREGVAATLERAFPSLDNRLINFLQLSRNPEGDPLKAAYVRSGAPSLPKLDLRLLKNPRAHRRGALALLTAVIVLVLPGVFIGRSWTIALWRTINPFSQATLAMTRIVDVQPGNTSVLQGQFVTLSCTVEGYRGHEIRVEVDPGDSAKATFALGKISSAAPQVFSHRHKKVATALRYRFRAGDSEPSSWYRVETRPPPSFTAIRCAVQPPAYTGLPARELDARKDRLELPAGSRIVLSAASNAPLKSARLAGLGPDTVALASPGEGARDWTVSTLVRSGSSLHLEAVDAYGSAFDEEIPFTLLPDRAPSVEIVTPAGRTILPPGERPRISFRIDDDYGLSQVWLEEIPGGEGEGKPRERMRWPVQKEASLEQTWTADLPLPQGQEVSFRLVACDNQAEAPNRTTSAPVPFSTPLPADLAKQRDELERKAFAGLQAVIELQKQNLAQTEAQERELAATPAGKWKETAQRQQSIRSVTKELLDNPVNPLGGLTAVVKKIYLEEMFVAIKSLEAVPSAAAGAKSALVSEALICQNKILRQLNSAVLAASQAKVERRIAGLSALLSELIRGQAEVLKQTQDFAQAKAEPGPALVDAQDELPGKLTAFVDACGSEAEAVRGNDPVFATTLASVGGRVTGGKIREDMVVAAERLDENKPQDAIPLQERALTGLKEIEALFASLHLEQEEERKEALLEAVVDAKEKIDRIQALREKMQAAMEQVSKNADKNDEQMDAMEEAYQELDKNTREALATIPNDLHIFTDLNVANDLVEDIQLIFQETEQTEENKQQTAKDVEELAYAKEDVLLEQMGEAQERLDDMEMWLGNKNDNQKVTTESFDKEEMPESGIALGELPTQVQDLIGDLLDSEEEMDQAADDSSTNHAAPDMPMGWEALEGDISSFAGKGHSSNKRPDHKEQDGRSNVGRQGMSNGETSAASGQIQEGDNNIEERRTTDPTQSGQIDLAGKADTRATGGGKLGTGKADGEGMSGGVERMDSMEEGSWAGMAELMAREADSIYAKASMKNIRVASLQMAAHHLRQAADAVARGNIQQVREQRNLALSSLQRAKAELDAGPSAAIEESRSTGRLEDIVGSGPDQAPAQYRDKVAEYFKALNESL